jgi:hypothetical protein
MKRIKVIVARARRFLLDVETVLRRAARGVSATPQSSQNHGLLFLNGALLTELADFTYSLSDGAPAQIQGAVFCGVNDGEAKEILRLAWARARAFVDVQMVASGDRFQTHGKFTHASLSSGVGGETKLQFRFECNPRCFS